MTPTCARCGHAESDHATPDLFSDSTRCKAKFWATNEADCQCAGFISVEQAEREAIRSEA